MSVYNGEKYLRDAITSVLLQSFSDFEFIIVNDGSNDDSQKIIDSFGDNRLRIVSRENRGLIASLNEAIMMANGEYLARLDADDICASERFCRQSSALDEDNRLNIVGSWAKKIDEEGRELGLMDYPPLDDRGIRKLFLFHNPFIHSSVMIRKSALLAVGLYHPGFKHCEDYELWSRLLKNGRGANIGEALISYRVSGSGITKKHNLFMRYQGLRARLLFLWRWFIPANFGPLTR